jgi:hypothetical protein
MLSCDIKKQILVGTHIFRREKKIEIKKEKIAQTGLENGKNQPLHQPLHQESCTTAPAAASH